MSFVLYRSSAGSGKTYTLVKEYLKLVLKNPEQFQNILAVTFTNKAAAEMKERILLALKKLAKGEDENLAKALTESFQEPIDIPARCAELQTRLLHNYSDFAILTIDSFIHRVLRAFALETGLPLSFSIELNYERLYAYVLERLIGYVGKNPYITKIILRLVDDRLNERKSWNLEKEIKNFIEQLFSEKNIDWAKKIANLHPEEYENMVNQLEHQRRTFVSAIKGLCCAANTMIKNANLSVDDFAYTDKGVASFFEKKANLAIKDLTNLEINKHLINKRWYAKNTQKEVQARIDELVNTGLGAIRQDIITLYDAEFPVALTAHFILKNFSLAAIVKEIKFLIEEYKQRYNVVPISDFNIKVYEIVCASPVPFIYEMLGEKFNHYLVDEFQDTSKLQWNNLYPLIDNSLASNYFNLAVGDGKQSIYRWRGGDVAIMESEIRQGPLQIHLKEKNLTQNFRSRAHVVEFNNRFFAQVSATYQDANPMLGKIYSDISQKPAAKAGGWVTLQLTPEAKNKEEMDVAVFEKVNTIIRTSLQNQGYTEGDIAILVRDKKDGKKIAENLMKQPEKFKVVSPDSLVLANIPLIRFLIDVLTYIDDPQNSIAKAAITYYLCLHRHTQPFTPEAIGLYFMNKEESWFDQYPELDHFMKSRDFLLRLPVYEVIEEIIRLFQLHHILDFQPNAYLQAFLNIVANYATENSADFSTFLDWWQTNNEDFTLEVPENAKAIKIMTIHKAKGLEFPIVIIPYANWSHKLDKLLWLEVDPVAFPLQPPLEFPVPVKSIKKLSNSLFKDQVELEKKKVEMDNINLLYVAFTRAIDQLHIIASPKKKNEESKPIEEEENVALSYSNLQLLEKQAIPIMQKVPGEDEYYSLGAETHKETTNKKDRELAYYYADEFISSQWYKKITIRRKAIEFWRFDSNYTEERRRWGVLVHQVLASVKNRNDVPVVVNRLLHAGDIEAHEEPQLNEKIKALFTNDIVNEWFSPDYPVFSECSIITDNGVLRPDRVIITPAGATLIDFKTGNPTPSHTSQIMSYKKALHHIGYQSVAAYLLYLDNCQIVPVTQ